MSTFDLIVLGFFAFAAVGGVIDLPRFLLKHGELPRSE